jgi:hypothetical protein
MTRLARVEGPPELDAEIAAAVSRRIEIDHL